MCDQGVAAAATLIARTTGDRKLLGSSLGPPVECAVPVPSDGVAPAARGHTFFIRSMALYAATIFVSAFLLFLVQPIMAKQILPWFGGSANVWTTCLVFFQTTLLLGYAYADLVVRRTSARTQIRIHVALLALSCIVLPIVPGAQWKPIGTESPSLLILALLTATIGLPYFLLSTTSPLVPVWYSRSFPCT